MRRAYSHSEAAAIFLLFIASPFLLIRKLRKQNRHNRKTLIERSEESYQKSLEMLERSRQRLWDTVKDKRKNEDDVKWQSRLKKYGFTPEGIHIKTGKNYSKKTETEDEEMIIDIKARLKTLEGETFHTVTGIPYTYEFVGENMIRPSRTSYTIHLSNFEKAIDIAPTDLKQLRSVRGPSYVFGIITDSRFR